MQMSSPMLRAVDARTDAQTGLPSRAALEEDLRRRLAESQRHGNRLSLVLIKIGSLRELMERSSDGSEKLVLRACTHFFVAAARNGSRRSLRD